MKKDSTISNIPEYQFDAYTGVFLTGIYQEIPLIFIDNQPDSAIAPLVNYLLENINIFSEFQVQPCKPINGYRHALEFICPNTTERQFKLLYGGRSQNGTICLHMVGKTTNIAYNAIRNHFRMKTTRIDSAVNYLGNYHAMQKMLKRLTDKEPSHRGNNSGGHTYYFGSRTSTTFIRHYEWGKCHYPNQPDMHDQHRIEVEYKPKDLAHQTQAQDLTAEQVFIRSTMASTIHQRIFKRDINPFVMAKVQTKRNHELEESLSYLAINYMKTWKKLLVNNQGDIESIGHEIFEIIEKHEKWVMQK